jgi:hypothetical protein
MDRVGVITLNRPAPNNLDVYHQLASLYEETGQDGKASEVLEKILEIVAEQEQL